MGNPSTSALSIEDKQALFPYYTLLVKGPQFWNKVAWIQNIFSPLVRCANVGKLLSSFGTPFSQL